MTTKRSWPVTVGNCIRVDISGGLVSLALKSYRQPYETKLTLNPAIARRIALEMIAGADAIQAAHPDWAGAIPDEARLRAAAPDLLT